MRGDHEIEEVMDRYGDAVLRACRAYFPNRYDAEDAFQDTFIKFAVSDTVFTDEDHRKAWLIRVAVNICKDRLRSSSAKSVELDEEHLTSMACESPAKSVDERLTMRLALQSLPPDNRVALVLSVVEGFKAQEIAEIMDKPLNTVYSLITRGKEKLRKVIEHD